MAGNITFTIIKPGAVNHEHIGPILTMINKKGFRISAMKYLMLSRKQAVAFYNIHNNKSFFSELVEFMISGPIVAAILEKENAVSDYRKLIGSTDPSKAKEGTIRNMFAESMERNAVHGSDSDANARIESYFFFSNSERFSKEGFCFIE